MDYDPKQTTFEQFCILYANKCSHNKVTKWMLLCLIRGIKLNCDKSELFKESLVHAYQIILNNICWTKALILIVLSNKNIWGISQHFYFINDLCIIFWFYCVVTVLQTFEVSYSCCCTLFSLMLEAMLGHCMVN